MRKKCLILGGKGFLGEHLVTKLEESRTWDLIVADKQVETEVSINGTKYIPIEFSEKSDLGNYLKGVDTVIHLISTIFPNDDTDEIEREITDNTFATLNLLRSMVRVGCKKIVFLSSGGTIYGDHKESPISEDEAGFPVSNYGIIKDMIEKYIYLFNHYYGLDYRIVRLSNPYSGENIIGRKQGLIPILISKIKNKETIQIWGDGNHIRDYIHIEDAMDAIERIINYGGDEKIFNVGTGEGHSINDILRIVSDATKVTNIDVEYTESRICDVDYNVLDIQLLREKLNFSPKYSLERGIRQILNNEK